ncbi:hypothetical protein PCE1_004037 [Barthelona sp. PCE]
MSVMTLITLLQFSIADFSASSLCNHLRGCLTNNNDYKPNIHKVQCISNSDLCLDKFSSLFTDWDDYGDLDDGITREIYLFFAANSDELVLALLPSLEVDFFSGLPPNNEVFARIMRELALIPYGSHPTCFLGKTEIPFDDVLEKAKPISTCCIEYSQPQRFTLIDDPSTSMDISQALITSTSIKLTVQSTDFYRCCYLIAFCQKNQRSVTNQNDVYAKLASALHNKCFSSVSELKAWNISTFWAKKKKFLHSGRFCIRNQVAIMLNISCAYLCLGDISRNQAVADFLKGNFKCTEWNVSVRPKFSTNVLELKMKFPLCSNNSNFLDYLASNGCFDDYIVTEFSGIFPKKFLTCKTSFSPENLLKWQRNILKNSFDQRLKQLFWDNTSAECRELMNNYFLPEHIRSAKLSDITIDSSHFPFFQNHSIRNVVHFTECMGNKVAGQLVKSINMDAVSVINLRDKDLKLQSSNSQSVELCDIAEFKDGLLFLHMVKNIKKCREVIPQTAKVISLFQTEPTRFLSVLKSVLLTAGASKVGGFDFELIDALELKDIRFVVSLFGLRTELSTDCISLLLTLNTASGGLVHVTHLPTQEQVYVYGSVPSRTDVFHFSRSLDHVDNWTTLKQVTLICRLLYDFDVFSCPKYGNLEVRDIMYYSDDIINDDDVIMLLFCVQLQGREEQYYVPLFKLKGYHFAFNNHSIPLISTNSFNASCQSLAEAAKTSFKEMYKQSTENIQVTYAGYVPHGKCQHFTALEPFKLRSVRPLSCASAHKKANRQNRRTKLRASKCASRRSMRSM